MTGDHMIQLIPYYASSPDTMQAQAEAWASLGVESPFALENVPMHIVKGEAYHDDPDQAIRHLNWFRRHRWPRYQGLGMPVLDYEPATEDGGRSSWRWVEHAHQKYVGTTELWWVRLLNDYVLNQPAIEGVSWYNTRNRYPFCSSSESWPVMCVTRPAAATETITPAHMERHADYTDIWCIDAHQLDYDNLEAFEESRKPVAIWLRDSKWRDVEVTVEMAGAKRREA